MSARVLVAEDDAALARVVESLLAGAGLAVTMAPDGQAALERYAAAVAAGAPPDVVLADLAMPRVDGLELLDRLRALDPELPVVLITAFASVDSAVAALRKGAHDYVTKPFRNDQLLAVLRNAATQRRLARENRALRREVDRAFGVTELVGRSPGLAEVLRKVERAGPTEAAVLIRGETGTGKELVARALHHASRRAGGPFVSLNCAALPEGLLESELFGHVKGAFTGATSASAGLFRAASGGTLFLDEVGEMSPALQAKLLRVLEAREVRPVGATEVVAVDVRVVSATHRDLLAEAAREPPGFREDLFYRLAVIEVDLPPLRARPGDVPLLARHFLRELARARGEPERALSPAALEALARHSWPGNVRELKGALEHAVTMGDETLEPEDLPPRVLRALEAAQGARPGPAPAARPDGVETLADLERRHTLAVLARFEGDRRQAAEALGIDLSTLYRKLKRWEAGEA
ncbi:MAG: sigma-54 dependent transcriptional regulator [Planctomycetes bacterium]|nr:sigma-54 dependent transcriptional regulator [Planctomycetota bacterium]